MKKEAIYFFIGTTAELIKLAPVIKELKKRKAGFKIIASNQNVLYFNELKPLIGKQSIYYKSALKPFKLPFNNKYFRFIFWAIKSLGNFILYFNSEFKSIRKDKSFLIVHGDTVSSLIGAIAAKINRIQLVHIESGLRSYNFFEPFPEELCRVIVSRLADIHFCPNAWSVNNLKKLGGVKVNTINNTLIETLHKFLKIKKKLRNVDKKFYILVLHRQEHIVFQKKLVIKLLDLFTEYTKENLICVLILHTLTEKLLREENLLYKLKRNKNIILVPRLPYGEFINLMRKAEFIATDGGSNQEEAYYLGKPCLILRNVTERIEGLGENAVLSHEEENTIRDFVRNYKKYERNPIQFSIPPSKIIVDYLMRY